MPSRSDNQPPQPTGPEPGPGQGSDIPGETEPLVTIEPDLSRAPPPPAWKPIAPPPNLPGGAPPTSAAARSRQAQQPLWELSAMGTEFVMFVLAGVGLGWLADNWLGTKPYGVLVGVLFGLGGGGWRLIRSATRALNRATPPRPRPQGTSKP